MAYEPDKVTANRLDYERPLPREGGSAVWVVVVLLVGVLLVAIWAFSGTDGTAPVTNPPAATTDEPIAPAEPVPSTGIDPAAPAEPVVPDAADPAVPAVPAEPAPAD